MITEFRGEYAFLSNFAECEVWLDGLKFASVENAFQAAKSKDLKHRYNCQHCTPSQAKAYGRHVKLEDGWNDRRFKVMRDLCCQKFAKGTELRKKLDATGSAYLIEGNTWHDNTWGACHCERCKTVLKHNYLGKLLMLIRSGAYDRKEK